jgi:hypothetical protein
MEQARRAAVPVIRNVWERLPDGSMQVAAAFVVVFAVFVYVDVGSIARGAASYVGGMFSRSDSAAAPDSALASGPDAYPVPDPNATAAFDRLAGSVDATVAEAPGTMAVFSRVPLDLYISGKRIGSTEDGQIILRPGTYRVEAVNQRLNYRGAFTLNIRPAAITSHTVTLPNGQLQVNTEPGAVIVVEGKRMGVAPAAPLPVAIGTREIVVMHPDLGERREFVEVRFGEVTQVTIVRREVIDPSKDYPLPNLGQPSAPIR